VAKNGAGGLYRNRERWALVWARLKEEGGGSSRAPYGSMGTRPVANDREGGVAQYSGSSGTSGGDLTPAGHGDRGRPGWRWEGAVGAWVDLKRKKTG
jgi:hypothetical protein